MKSILKTCLFIGIVSSVSLFAMGAKEIPDNGRKNVAVTFDAMKELTQAVAGDNVNISVIIPPGMEAHDFEPKAKDLAFLSKADVLIYNGLGMEFWLDEAIKAVNNKKLIMVEASSGIEPIKAGHHNHDEHGEDCDCEACAGKPDDKEHEHCHHGEFDPHTWLSLSSAKIMIKNIENVLAAADPENAKSYKENASKYISEIDELLKEYIEKFSNVKNKHFVTGHAAFGYLCRDFSLEQNSVTDIFNENEPNPKELAKLVEYCREHKVKVIFTEEAASPLVSKTLAAELGARVEKIYTIESPEDNKTYLERMKANLMRIYENLK
ncbi:metal ABC transporter substrate-binding protein [Treponema putidum]|uniref:ABC transporter substrate-binding protein n=1 Tax=Treponema putidum TaxID=221027 RepID=A0AAE9MSL7_9SPIR|nr:metal ABC transporter substrate-binding protein [Treponema putidum]AIN94092.1 ABC transporter substrate-binding protein [Treponema putidum]TWI77060.1 zinc transport system substrate-binding protein [Treponema putidum]UTY28039.1 ABC transporter substrate-binding protein [Treponema putidum]UTY30528.1 ABC transporter substrate-binding protein [Treponema putidum]UTY32945.1 ABC transporter substrate-binding protein [Treponema putidum]